MRPLTHRQQRVLNFLQKKVDEQGLPPSIREIGEALNISSLRGVTDHLVALEKKGYLYRSSHSRGIRLTGTQPSPTREGNKGEITTHPGPVRHSSFTLPLVGQVAAGQPILAEENLEGSMVVDPLFARDENCFVLKVRGESMIQAGIFDGDYVVVRQQESAENGDIVVAMLEDEATVKRFFSDGKHIRLQPENASMEPIYISSSKAAVAVLGKVVGVMRKVA